MTFTSHGHHIPGTTQDSLYPPQIARCGGVGVCKVCTMEAKEFIPNNAGDHIPPNVPTDFPSKAKRILVNYIDSHHSVGFDLPEFDVYVVWFVKVLQHWKALVSTDRPDGKYYELTYNGDKKETYVDEYEKIMNTVIPDSEDEKASKTKSANEVDFSEDDWSNL